MRQSSAGIALRRREEAQSERATSSHHIECNERSRIRLVTSQCLEPFLPCLLEDWWMDWLGGWCGPAHNAAMKKRQHYNFVSNYNVWHPFSPLLRFDQYFFGGPRLPDSVGRALSFTICADTISVRPSSAIAVATSLSFWQMNLRTSFYSANRLTEKPFD